MVVALVGLALAVALQVSTQNGTFLPGWVIFTLIWSCVLATATMKWTIPTPVSAFKLIPRAILAARQTTSGKVWGFGAGAAWVLAIFIGAARAVAPTVLITLVLIIFTWSMGVGAGKAGARVMGWMEQVRDAVARALPCDPRQLEGGNSGNLQKPEVTLLFPRLLEGDQGMEFVNRFAQVAAGTGWHILGMDPQGATICLAKDAEYHQARKR